MTVALAPQPLFQAFGYNGLPLVGGLLYTYAAGTSTPQATYVDSTQTTQNTNPVILNVLGQANVWLNSALTYKFVLEDAFGNQLWAIDEIQSNALTSQAIGMLLYPTTIAETTAGITPVSFQYPPGWVWRYESAAYIVDWLAGSYQYDHGTAIQTAVNSKQPVYMPQGNPQILTSVTCANSGQKIYGAGMYETVINVPATFNLTAQGIFNVTAAEPSVEMTDFWISCYQPVTSTYSSLIAYPPAIYMQASPRAKIRRIRITLAKTAIDARQNSGGSYFEDLELSHLDNGIWIDGSEDTMRVLNCHFFPFNVSGALLTLYYSTSNTGLKSGRCDDLVLDAALFLCGQGANFYVGTISGLTGQTFGSVTDTDFDTYNGIMMSGGNIQCNGCDINTETGYVGINHTGGQLAVTGGLITAAAGSTTIISNVSSSANGALSITDNTFAGTISDITTMIALSVTSGTSDVIINANRFLQLPQNTTQENTVITCASGPRLTFTNNTANDKGTGAGLLLSIAADAPHIIQGNNFFGWGISLPASPTYLNYSGNSSVANNGTTILATESGTGAFSASTTVTINHGVNAYGTTVGIKNITIQPTSAPPSGGVWVSATGAATFTVTAAASTSMTFSWQIANATAT